MKRMLQIRVATSITDKFLYGFKFFGRTGLETLTIVKNETQIMRRGMFNVDIRKAGPIMGNVLAR
jgi:hypothetical protein